jgi:ATP-dependent Clp protease ATP-binding subunit ClpB
LGKSNLSDILNIRLREINQRIGDRARLEFTDAAKSWLSEHGYEPAYGARPLNRLLQHEVLNPLAKLILNGDVRKNDKVVVDSKEGTLLVERKD